MRDRDWNNYRENSRRHDDDYSYDGNSRGSSNIGGDYGETGRGYRDYGRESYGRGEYEGSPRGRESDYGRRMYREDARNWDTEGRSGSGSTYGDEYERRRPGQYGDRRGYEYGQGSNYGGGYGASMGRGSDWGVGSSGAYGESMGRGSEYDRGSSAGGYGTDYGRYGGVSRMSGSGGRDSRRDDDEYGDRYSRGSRYEDRSRDERSDYGSYNSYRGQEDHYGRGDDRGSYGQGSGRSNARMQGGGNYRDEWYSAEGEHGPNYERRSAYDRQAGRDLGYGDSDSGRYSRRR